MSPSIDAPLRGLTRPRQSFSVGRADLDATARPGFALVEMIRAGRIAPAARPVAEPEVLARSRGDQRIEIDESLLSEASFDDGFELDDEPTFTR